MALIIAALLVREAYAGKVDDNRHLAAQLAQATAQQTAATAAQVCLAKLNAPVGLLAIQIQAETARYLVAPEFSPARSVEYDRLTTLLDQQDEATKTRNAGADLIDAGKIPPGCAPIAPG